MKDSGLSAPGSSQPPGPFVITPMEEADIAEIAHIDVLSFSTPWQAEAYRRELMQASSHFFVARLREERVTNDEGRMTNVFRRPSFVIRRLLGSRNHHPTPRVLGYGGLWLWLDEAHISTIAVHPDWRGQGIGELLLVALLERSVHLRALQCTLEVRVSNEVAQNLYKKYGFENVGTRRRYYRDNNEDAYIMTVPALDAAYVERLARLKATLWQRLGAQRRERVR
jgi:ribosomal-protein-alanine N-acetyltransferase